MYTGWPWLVGSITLLVLFAKEPYKRDDILQKRPIILSSLLTVATPYLVTRLMVLTIVRHVSTERVESQHMARTRAMSRGTRHTSRDMSLLNVTRLIQ